jgi:non-heme chloroperoxidase
MKKIGLFLFSTVLIAAAIYLAIAAALIVFGKPKTPSQDQKSLAFKEVLVDYKNLPALRTFSARDGKQLAYRYYPAQSDKVVILLHGSGWHSQYFFPLAEYLSSENLAQVYTPDLRGHGPKPERRGDVDYIGQLDDDLADLLAMIQKQCPQAKIIIGGHSSGGGLAIRFAGSQYGRPVKAYLLLSPYLQYNAPTMRSNSGGWAQPYTGRIIGLTLLNNVQIRWFNHLTAIAFNMPQEVRNGTETLSYSFRLNTSYAPGDYKKDLRAIKQPLLVLAGTADEAFIAEQFQPVISQYTKVQVKLLPGVAHMGVVVGSEVRPVIHEWLRGLDPQS